LAQSLNRPLGLHCLLYLVADRICEAEIVHPDSSIADALSTSEHRLARVVGSAIKAFMWDPPRAPDDQHVFVPCRPTLAVPKHKLESRLLMAALLECRDLGLVELRLAHERIWRGQLGIWDPGPGLVRVVPLATFALDGFCGQIIKQLERKGDQGARKLFTGVKAMIDRVESELADRGYMRPMVMTRRWRAQRRVEVVVDCEQIQDLAEDCALAVDRWNRTWAADATLCKALLSDCSVALVRRSGGGA
jgi:hypothetical protein